jgi:hypothetical protein
LIWRNELPFFEPHFGYIPQPEKTAAYVASLQYPHLARDLPHLIRQRQERDINLWDALLTVKPSWKRGAQGIGDCYAAGTIVFGRHTKPIEQVKVGDLVWSGTGKLTPVISTQTKVSMKPLVRITPWGGVPLEVTEDHKVLVYRMPRYRGKRITKNYYERMKLHSEQSKANSKWQVNRPSVILEAYENRSAEWIAAGELRDADCLLTPLKFQTSPIPHSPNGLTSTNSGMFLLGNFVGDGCVESKKCSMLRWSCSTEKFANHIAKILSNHGLKSRVSKHGNAECWDVRVHCSILGRWLNESFYDASRVKVFPDWAIGNVWFLAGLKSADGFRSGRINCIDSTSASIAYGAFASLLHLGYEPTISNSGDRIGGGVFANAKPIYRTVWRKNKEPHRIWKDGKFFCRPIRRLERIEGPHVVYDIGVADDCHSFIANSVISRNCVSWGHELVCTMLLAMQAVKGESSWIEEAATEAIYGLRCEVDQQFCNLQDGWYGSGAAEGLQKYGVLLRLDYSKETGKSEHDLTSYDAKRAKDWGRYGMGGKDSQELDTISKKYPCHGVTQVRTVLEAAAAIDAGCPVSICSGVGFGEMERNSDGIVRRSGSWAHCMMLGGIRYKSGDPQFRIFQSWGKSASGPDPGIASQAVSDCSWWAVSEDIERILREDDSFAFSRVEGFALPPWNFSDDWLV